MSEISVIIPIYNASCYLPRCLDSILAQTFTDWQLLLVDDGSTDASLQVMQEYQAKDRRIKCFHKQNEGVSLTRQYGLDRVETPYFIYCDADDYVESDYLELLYQAIKENDADLAVCDYREEYENGSIIHHFDESSYLSFLKSLLLLKCWGVTWNKLYKTEIARKAKIEFIPHLQMWEDLAFTVAYCVIVSHVAFVPEVLYHYNKMSSESLTTDENLQKNHDRVAAIKQMESHILSSPYAKDLQSEMIWLKFHIKDAYALFGYPSRKRYELWQQTFSEVNAEYASISERKLLHWFLVHHIGNSLYIRWYYIKGLRKLKKWIKYILFSTKN